MQTQTLKPLSFFSLPSLLHRKGREYVEHLMLDKDIETEKDVMFIDIKNIVFLKIIYLAPSLHLCLLLPPSKTSKI